MKFGKTLNNLIRIAEISKTDFAHHLSMSPSGLSRILSGEKLPPNIDKKSFIQKTTTILCDNLWEVHCYLKFKNVFPVIYDFQLKIELHLFLENALEYIIENDYALQNKIIKSNSISELSYLDNRLSFNMLCIILSELLIYTKEKELNVYTNYPLFKNESLFSIDKIKLLTINNINIKLNISTNVDNIESHSLEDINFILSQIHKSEKLSNLVLYNNPNNKQTCNYYFYVENQFVILLHRLSVDKFIFTHIKQQSFLIDFPNIIKEDFLYQRTFFTNEQNIDQSILDLISNESIKFILNFQIDFLKIYNKKIENQVSNKIIAALISNIVESGKNLINADFYITEDAIISFFKNDGIRIPFNERIDSSTNKKLEYIKKYRDEYNYENNIIHFSKSELSQNQIICFESLCIIYEENMEKNKDKIHVIKNNNLEVKLREFLQSENTTIQDFEYKYFLDFVINLVKINNWI